MDFSDFEFKGLRLSDLGFVVCSFDGPSGLQSVDTGGRLTFQTVPNHKGTRWSVAGAGFAEPLKANFSICKNPCEFDRPWVSPSEHLEIMRWLSGSTYAKFHPIRDTYWDTYYNALFDVDARVLDGRIVGYDLTLYTDSPYGHGETIGIAQGMAISRTIITFDDESEAVGEQYPDIDIDVIVDGDIHLLHTAPGNTAEELIITGCVAGESISLRYPMISSTGNGIENRFNWIFPTVRNIYGDKTNQYKLTGSTATIDVSFEYSPTKLKAVMQ